MKKRGLFWPAANALFGLLLLVVLAACGASSYITPPNTSLNIPANTVRVHYHRNDGAYSGWGVYSWAGPVNNTPTWPTPNFLFTSADSDGWGDYTDIAMAANATSISFLILNPAGGGTKDTSADMVAGVGSLATAGVDLWVLSGNPTIYTTEPDKNLIPTLGAQAIWLEPGTMVWPGATGSSYKLYVAAKGGISSNATGVIGADTSYALTPATSISTSLQNQFPQFATAPALTVPTISNLKAALQGQMVIAAFDASGALITGTSVQTAPVLDSVYAPAASVLPLGLTFASDIPTFALWAPTATAVSLNVYATPTATATAYPMTLDPVSGVWSYTAKDATWTNSAYYDFNVTVFSRFANNTVVTNEVIDPYSVSLSANAKYSMVLNLKDATTAPSGWPGQLLPTSAAPTDSVIYELHVRDFSAYNSGAFLTNAGKYLAFTEANPGMAHLKTLAGAGLTHVHLLPVFATTSVDEVSGVNIDAAIPASKGDDAAAATFMTKGNATYGGSAPQGVDLFNWGYDPWVYGAPEGAFSSNANDGSKRVMEFRQMVQALHKAGLRVIMDVVYNHTAAAGQSSYAVLDRIVPGYYNRLDSNGNVSNQSCCSDIANENVMMGKLTTDTLVRWADAYKIDGFRFDEMGLLPLAMMKQALAAVNTVTQADGRGYTYFYGEGWSTTVPFIPASQAHMAGTGIGTFNDRMRDGVRGGGPFDSGATMVSNQGFASGLGYDPIAPATVASQTPAALANQNLIEVSLAGNLAAFPLNGAVTGGTLNYGGQNAGYTLLPQENLAYVSCHDNETVWDVSQYKQPATTSSSDRARAQVVDLSTVLLANGVAFIQAGDDLLRSKSMDSNSYDSGDYFNRIFWDGSSNNWGVGIPVQNTGNNAANLVQAQAALTNQSAAVTQSEILGASSAFQSFLAVRKSSTMFHLPDAASIISNVRFPDQGLGQIPGVVVMQVGDGTSSVGDNAFGSALTVFNASNTAQTITYPWYAGRNVSLHPAQTASADATAASASFNAATGAFTVPARTTAVFVEAVNNTFSATFPTMFYRGSTNGWGETAMKLVAPNTWQASLQLTAGAGDQSGAYGFKFEPTPNDPNWASPNYGDAGNGQVSTSGGNIMINATTGTYILQFNDATMTYRVLPPVWFPGVPTGLKASVITTSPTSLKLTWANSGGTLYTLYRSLDGTTFTQIGTATDGTAGYTDTGLTTGTAYYYEVTAGNALFTSGKSASAKGTPSSSSGPVANYPTMFMNGNWIDQSGYSDKIAMTLTANNTWTVTLPTIPAETIQFKFDTDGGWGNGTGATAWTIATTGTSGTCIVSGQGAGNINTGALTAGVYKVTFNDATLAFSIVPAS